MQVSEQRTNGSRLFERGVVVRASGAARASIVPRENGIVVGEVHEAALDRVTFALAKV